jgi:AraC family transcriptional regulator
MIYREMPAIWDPAFRPGFYASWGRENAVISAFARNVRYPEYRQLLSIKAATGGPEHYFVDGRQLSVDDDTFLILNAERSYGSRIDPQRTVHSFSVFFAPGEAQLALRALQADAEQLLDDPTGKSSGVEFEERLREHDQTISPRLKLIRRQIEQGAVEELWLEEQLKGLLACMLTAEHQQRRKVALIPSSRPATRRELHRRLGLATDFIHTCYRRRITLKDMAQAAHLSPFHFLRLFKTVHGVSPSVYLNRRRVSAARHLLQSSSCTLGEIAEQVGFGSRTSLYRHMRSCRGENDAEALT